MGSALVQVGNQPEAGAKNAERIARRCGEPDLLALRSLRDLIGTFGCSSALLSVLSDDFGGLDLDACTYLGKPKGGAVFLQLALTDEFLNTLNAGKNRPLTDEIACAAQTGMDGHGWILFGVSGKGRGQIEPSNLATWGLGRKHSHGAQGARHPPGGLLELFETPWAGP